MFNFITDPLSRLKWGFLPQRRDVPEEDADDILNQRVDESDSELENEPELRLEYRDEAGRKWWKFFDEYEYRSNKFTRSKHKWYKWFNENNTRAEKKLLLKLDVILTLYSLMAYWVKYLDQTNLNNAYVTSMKDDLNMAGNDLVNTQVLFNVGNIIFQIPFIYLLNVAPLNYLLPAFDIAWSIVTICIYKSEDVATLKGLRFLVGALESQAYYSYHFLLGSWFTADEISRRAMVFYFGQYLGVLTSGLISGAVVRGLDFVNGLRAWQWIFIVDGLVSLAVGFIGIYCIPGTPKDCYSIWLSDEEIRIARRRLIRNNIGSHDETDTLKKLFSWKLWKLILTSWEIYILSFWNIFCWNNNNGTSGSYILWLKSLTKVNELGETVQKYSSGRLQDLTALTPGLGLVWLTIVCTSADLFHSRWAAIFGSQVFNILGNVLLAVWHIPFGAKWFAFCLQYFGWSMAPVLYSWQNDICRRDQEKRSIILILMNAFAQSTTAFMAVIVWKTVDAPRYLKGFTFTACCGFALCLWTLIVLYFYKKNERKHAEENGIILYNSNNPNDIPEGIRNDSSDSLVEQENISADNSKVKEAESDTGNEKN